MYIDQIFFNDEWNKEQTSSSSAYIPGMEKSASCSFAGKESEKVYKEK